MVFYRRWPFNHILFQLLPVSGQSSARSLAPPLRADDFSLCADFWHITLKAVFYSYRCSIRQPFLECHA
jgi:hypothetical protein